MPTPPPPKKIIQLIPKILIYLWYNVEVGLWPPLRFCNSCATGCKPIFRTKLQIKRIIENNYFKGMMYEFV